MAIITLKSPFASFRGTTDYPHANGLVVYPVQNRHFARAFTPPLNPDTVMQGIVRAHLTAIAQAWQVVSDVNATTWDVLAAAMSPRIDDDGFEYDLNGQQAYVIVNMYRLLAGQAQEATAPAYSLPAAPGISEVIYDQATPDLEVVFSANVAQTGFVVLQISARTYSIRRQARLNEVFLPDHTTAICVGAVTAEDPQVTYSTTTFRFALVAAEIRGIRLTYLDANYVPGQIDFDTLEFKAPI